MNSNSKSPFPGVFGFGPGTELNLNIVGSNVLMSTADPPATAAPPNSVGFRFGPGTELNLI